MARRTAESRFALAALRDFQTFGTGAAADVKETLELIAAITRVSAEA